MQFFDVDFKWRNIIEREKEKKYLKQLLIFFFFFNSNKENKRPHFSIQWHITEILIVRKFHQNLGNKYISKVYPWKTSCISGQHSQSNRKPNWPVSVEYSPPLQHPELLFILCLVNSLFSDNNSLCLSQLLLKLHISSLRVSSSGPVIEVVFYPLNSTQFVSGTFVCWGSGNQQGNLTAAL